MRIDRLCRSFRLLICLAALPVAVGARTSEADLARLGKDLTPIGAERAGNADGSIPPWDGGLTKPPAGWQPGTAYVDPFAAEKPLFVITAQNADQYKERLTPGLLAVLKRYPNFRMPVYPSHRTAAFPKNVVDQARTQAPNVELNGWGLKNLGNSNIPFPVPKDGLELIWNHLVRYTGGGVEALTHSFPVRANGDYMKIGFWATRIYDDHFDKHVDNRLFWFKGYFTEPPDLLGTYYLVYEPIDQVSETRKAWIYNAGQRRVRRAPDLAYDNAQNGSDGLAVVDQYDGYNGSPDYYDWKILGKKEMYVAYNVYRMGDKALTYKQIIGKGTVNADYMRYELHRVWVLEARVKPGKSHVYARRTFYIDEDSWSVVLDDAYDSRGELWRTGIHGVMQYYDALVPGYRFELWHDLSNGAYVLSGLDNEIKGTVKFGVRGNPNDFTADALRREGTR